MTFPQRFYAIIAGLCLAAPLAGAQGLQPPSAQAPQPGAPNRPSVQSSSVAPSTAQLASTPTKPSAGVPAVPQNQASPRPAAHSLLDEPARPAQIQLANDQLSITATNSSLSEVIRQVANDTGMQVEGNSRDQRVFGSYGPGTPPEVLSALLYDSGYNVMMVGSTADGAPRRLVLTTRSAASTAPSTAPTHTSDEDDEEPAAEPPPPPQANPIIQGPPGVPPTAGQPKTPQQMLEELQRMHQGQQPPDLPHDNN